MPIAGSIRILVRPYDANWIAIWLRNYRSRSKPLGLLSSAITDAISDSHDLNALAAKFEKLARRRRAAPAISEVEMLLTRLDAKWLADQTPRVFGMFGKSRQSLPIELSGVCRQCTLALSRRRGRRTLGARDLASRVSGDHAIEHRHQQRLKARQVKQDAVRRSYEKQSEGGLGSLLAKALAKSD